MESTKVTIKNEDVSVYAKIKNLPSYELRQYTVVRLVDAELWFYGTYEQELRAYEVAKELGNGLVLEANNETDN